ncbi:MAG: MOSC domain-containing protein [Leptolyngbyaceae cyanobacterium bins.59]|nr:MOSC domain-containing protein [Leptolyngbyaceae cyanobacterium bins.59]
MTTATIKQIFIHPVKGLTPQPLDRAILQEGHGIPGDRAFALMYDEGKTDSEDETVPWLKKQHFAMQSDWPGLAGLECHYDAETATLRVRRQGVELLAAATNHPTGRQQIGTFFTGYLAALHPLPTARHPDRAPLRLVGGSPHTRYPDRNAVHLSLMSQATLDAITAWMGCPVDVRRFRPNLVIDGVEAWEEFTWVGREVRLGEARLAITAPIGRCPNIDINPDTGERDLLLFDALYPNVQHRNTGVLATVVTGGNIAIGDFIIT